MAITRASWQAKVLRGGPGHIHSASPNNVLVRRRSQSRRAMLADQSPENPQETREASCPKSWKENGFLKSRI